MKLTLEEAQTHTTAQEVYSAARSFNEAVRKARELGYNVDVLDSADGVEVRVSRQYFVDIPDPAEE